MWVCRSICAYNPWWYYHSLQREGEQSWHLSVLGLALSTDAYQDSTALHPLPTLCLRFCERKKIDSSHHYRGWDPRPTSGLVRHWEIWCLGHLCLVRCGWGIHLGGIWTFTSQGRENLEVWVHAWFSGANGWGNEKSWYMVLACFPEGKQILKQTALSVVQSNAHRAVIYQQSQHLSQRMAFPPQAV